MFSTRTLVKIRVEQANEQRKAFIKEKLASHVAAKHEYTDQSKSLCAPGTRREIQKEIEGWLSPQTSSSEHIFWITGIAGSGKSTLSATVVDNLRKKQTPVAAQFFISRNIPETIDTHKIIPTIAQQLSAFSPAAAQIIHDMLKHGLPPSQEEQVKALLLAPIQEICKSYGTVIILIDALDELQNAAKSVLQMLLQIAPKGCNLPDNIRFVITSRPEHWADISKSQTLELAVFKQHSLLTDSSVQEVSNFIHVKMDTILAEMREKDPIGWKSKWKDWPTEKQLRNLSEQANGLFHYAATALSWIEGQIDKHGTAAKQDFEKIAQKGLDPLNHLYGVILSSFKDLDPDRRPKQLLGFHHVLGTILVLREPLTIHQITALLADIPQDDFDVANFLKQFRSVLIPGMTTSFEEATPQMHKSFRDYITSAHAPVEFRILTGHAHFVTARSCLEVIVNKGGGDNPEKMYSVQYWHQHLQEAVNEGEKLEDEKRGKWLKQMADDERICNLLEQMVGDTAIDVWNTYSRRVFMAMATVGWKLLEQGTHEDRVKAISNIVRKAKEVCAFSSVARPCPAHCPSPSHL
ncbi:hypothetical protein B0H16DRAFT_1023797 [Mycena metata]|uniref:NACHT domain-containing protein n=1 Tax=Mycena metata TaxID=1033252 RepID=A0AAD7IG62_9AGAR|nr:hypothetical protein B0H16DRAFT_1023797 [Mycena metata]